MRGSPPFWRDRIDPAPNPASPIEGEMIAAPIGLIQPGTIRQGGCGCGAVRYRIDRDPIFVNNCYCAICQLQTGSTSSAYAFFEAEAVQILSGELVRFAQQTSADRKQQVSQCAHCGIGLFFQPWPTGRHGICVRLGSLDDPSDIVPDAAVYVSERMPWVTLPEGVPTFDAYYDPPKLLPADRNARLQRLLDRHAADQLEQANQLEQDFD